MNVNFKIIGNILIVRIEGEIDHHTVGYLRERVDAKMIMSPIKNIIFDFSKVTFMDSSGIGMIIGRYNKISRLDGKIIIVNPSRHINKILDMSGISKIIPIKTDGNTGTGIV